MKSFLIWLGRNRKRIGYSAGALNILAAVVYAVQGDISLAMLWFAIGLLFIFDTIDGPALPPW